MTNTIQINNLNETLGYIGDELAIIAEKPPVEINKDGVTPTETAETITIGDDSYSIGGGGGSYTLDVIMGSLNRVYGTTPANYIGTFSQWIDIDAGKSFSDYDEIILVSCPQADDVASGAKNRVLSVRPTYLLEYYDKLNINEYYGTNNIYVNVSLDFTNNKFFLNNYNYLCPIALMGIKY